MPPLAPLSASLALLIQPAEPPRAAPAAACLPDSQLIELQVAPKIQKLGDLPKGRLMLPVLRRVEGCSIPTFISGPLEGDGRFAPPAARTQR